MEKVDDLRKGLNKSDKTSMVISEPDEIAWLFNMRGEGESIVDSLMVSPLFQSLALVTLDSLTLWIHKEKINDEIRNHLIQDNCSENNICVVIEGYSNATTDLRKWALVQEKVSTIYIENVHWHVRIYIK